MIKLIIAILIYGLFGVLFYEAIYYSMDSKSEKDEGNTLVLSFFGGLFWPFTIVIMLLWLIVDAVLNLLFWLINITGIELLMKKIINKVKFKKVSNDEGGVSRESIINLIKRDVKLLSNGEKWVPSIDKNGYYFYSKRPFFKRNDFDGYEVNKVFVPADVKDGHLYFFDIYMQKVPVHEINGKDLINTFSILENELSKIDIE